MADIHINYLPSKILYVKNRLLKLGVPLVVINCNYLSFVQIHAHFCINYIIYYGLLIFCCQNVAIMLFTLQKYSYHIPPDIFKKPVNRCIIHQLICKSIYPTIVLFLIHKKRKW